MGFVVFLTTVLLIVLLTTFLVIDNNRKKALALEKQQQSERIDVVSSRYSKIVQSYGKSRIVKPKDISGLSQINNNYFVMQRKTDETITHYEQVIGNLTDLLENELLKFESADDKLTLSKQIYAFVEQLPTSGHQFNSDFYWHQLPSLSQQVITPTLASTDESVEPELHEENV